MEGREEATCGTLVARREGVGVGCRGVGVCVGCRGERKCGQRGEIKRESRRAMSKGTVEATLRDAQPPPP